MESLAERARAAVDDRPFLRRALAAGVVNYAAAARTLDLDSDDSEAVSAALRRYAEDLALEADPRTAQVTMRSRLGETDGDDALLAVNGTAFATDAGTLTGVLASGDVDASVLATALERLAVDDIEAVAAGVAGDALLVVVARRDGPDAVRLVEAALDAHTGVRANT